MAVKTPGPREALVDRGGLPSERFLAWMRGVGGKPWRLVETWTWSANVTEVDFAGIGDDEIMVQVRGLTLSVAGTRNMRVSTDNGATFLSTSGDYLSVNGDGTETALTSLAMHNTDSALARSGVALGFGFQSANPLALGINRTATWLLPAGPINAIRVYPSSGGNITAGTIRVFGR